MKNTLPPPPESWSDLDQKWPSATTGRKGTSWLKWHALELYQLIWHYHPPDSIQGHPDTPGHLPDTVQTPHRHPKIKHFFAFRRLLGEKEPADWNNAHWNFINWFGIRTSQTVFRVTQTPQDTFSTPSRHPTDTPNSSTFFAYLRPLGEKEPADCNNSHWLFFNW